MSKTSVIADLTCQQAALVACKLLDLEVIELRDALEADKAYLILDEVVDVIYRAREVAAAVGISDAMLTEYSQLKDCVRTRVGKNKSMELHIARGVIVASDEDDD